MHAAMAERLGLSPSDHKALDLLDRHGPMTAGELAGYTGLTSGAITGMADRLERAGHLRRVRDPHDRRRVILERDHGGDAHLNAAFGPLLQRTEALLNAYNEAALQVILDFLQRANAIAEAHDQPLGPA